MSEVKHCGGCQETKPISSFAFRSRAKGYRQSRCKSCQSDESKRRWVANRDENVSKMRAYRQSIPRETWAAKQRDYRERNPPKPVDPDIQRDRQMRSRYGITTEDYDRQLERQGGVCATCKEPESIRHMGRVKRLAIDHCHETGTVRGLLCANCNQGLGHFKHDSALLVAAAAYLLNPPFPS